MEERVRPATVIVKQGVEREAGPRITAMTRLAQYTSIPLAVKMMNPETATG